MNVSFDVSHELAPDFEPPMVLLTVSLEVMDDSSNAKAEDPPPKVDIPSSEAKVENAPPVVVPPNDDHPIVGHVVSIDHRDNLPPTKQNLLHKTIC